MTNTSETREPQDLATTIMGVFEAPIRTLVQEVKDEVLKQTDKEIKQAVLTTSTIWGVLVIVAVFTFLAVFCSLALGYINVISENQAMKLEKRNEKSKQLNDLSDQIKTIQLKLKIKPESFRARNSN